MSLMDLLFFFFFLHAAPTEIYTLSLHDALPISRTGSWWTQVIPVVIGLGGFGLYATFRAFEGAFFQWRSEEHTSELQSQSNLVCRLLLEKKKAIRTVCTRSA